MTVQDIIKRVQRGIGNATGEPNSDWTDADLILEKLETISDDIAVRLQLLDLNYSTVEVILPNVPANTADLANFQKTGQPLALMILPKTVEWRLPGRSQKDWSFVPQVDKAIDTDSGTGLPLALVASSDIPIQSWEYRGGILRLSPSRQALDLRIRFAGVAMSLKTNSDAQIVGLTNAYVYKCCQVILEERSSGMTTLSATFEKRYNRACADFEALSVKVQHSKRMRLGGRRSGGRSGFTPPIVG